MEADDLCAAFGIISVFYLFYLILYRSESGEVYVPLLFQSMSTVVQTVYSSAT